MGLRIGEPEFSADGQPAVVAFGGELLITTENQLHFDITLVKCMREGARELVADLSSLESFDDYTILRVATCQQMLEEHGVRLVLCGAREPLAAAFSGQWDGEYSRCAPRVRILMYPTLEEAVHALGRDGL